MEKSAEQARKEALFQKQKELLDTFLAHKAIDRRQYDKSLNCLREKLGITDSSKTSR